MPNRNTAVVFDDVWFRYEKDQDFVLRGITLEIHVGELVAIVGPNGAGKTTLIKHINGLLKPSKGRVTVFDVDTRKTSTAKLSKIVGLVFQNPNHQLFAETVEEEVLFGLRNFGISNPSAS